MEPVDIDTPRGAAEAIARLTVDTVDLELWFDLRFSPVEHDLGPAVLALARLAGGTLVGFAHVGGGPSGVEVVAFDGREPRDVLVELLFETELDHDQVAWRLPPREPGDGRRWARTFGEAYLWFLMEAEDAPSDADVLDAIGTWYLAEGDSSRMRLGDLELWVLPEPADLPPGKHVYSAPGQPASTIIDAGRWVFVAHDSAETARGLLARPIDADVYLELAENLARAASAFDEALKFVPPGAEAVPVRACWSEAGLRVYREGAPLFRREYLQARSEEYHAALDGLRERYAPRFAPAQADR